MSTQETLLNAIPSMVEIRRFMHSDLGVWVFWGGIAALFLLLGLWLLRRRRLALENLGLPKLRRELSDIFGQRKEPGTDEEEEPVLAREETVDPLPQTDPLLADNPAPQSSELREPVLGNVPAQVPAPAPVYAQPPVSAVHVLSTYEMPDDIPPLLDRLPFEPRAGLSTGRWLREDMKVEAVFVSEALEASLKDNSALELLPFVPQARSVEQFNNIYRWGALIAQPHALLQTEGMNVVVTRSVLPQHFDAQNGWQNALRDDELLLAVLNALVVSHELNTPCAAVLAASGVRFFLRPSAQLVEDLVREQGRACDFAMSVSKRNTLSAVIYASLFAAARA